MGKKEKVPVLGKNQKSKTSAWGATSKKGRVSDHRKNNKPAKKSYARKGTLTEGTRSETCIAGLAGRGELTDLETMEAG